MKNNPEAKHELIILAGIVILLILSGLVGTTTVTDDSLNVDSNGYPVTDKTFEDFEASGTKFAILTGTEWG